MDERTGSAPPVHMPRRSDRLWLVALAIVTAGAAGDTYAMRFTLLNFLADTWVHLALVRRTMERGWFPGNPFYAGMPTPPNYSLEHVMLAALSTISHVPPHELWLSMPPIAMVATISAVFVWLHALTKDTRIAAVGATVELLVQAPDPAWTCMPYPRALALAPYALALFWYLRGRERGRVSCLIAAGAAFGICLDIHAFTGASCLLSLIFLEIALAPSACRVSRLALTAVSGVAISVPWLINLFNASHGQSLPVPALDAIEYPITQDAWTIQLKWLTMTICPPGRILDALPWPLWLLGIYGLTLCLGRWCRGRSTAADRYALVATAGTLALLLTPFYGILLAAGGLWTIRMVRVIPLALLVGTGASAVAEFVAERVLSRWHPLMRRVVACGLIASLACGAIQMVRADVRNGRIALAFGNRALQYLNLAQELAVVHKPRVVLSDPVTSYLLPYFFGCWIVAAPQVRTFVDSRARELAVRRFYDRGTSMDERRSLLERYDADTVAVQLNARRRDDDAHVLLDQLRADSAFKDTGCCGDLRFFLYGSQVRVRAE